MNAIVRTGGKQYNVSPGDIIQVETLQEAEGEVVSLDDILLVRDGETVTIGTPVVENASVKVKVLSHGRGKKIKVFKFKRRKQYHRTQGHRQDFTRIQIEEIVSN